MSETTNIGWTASTWNPWRGCTKVSPGCAYCYMFRDQVKYGRDPSVVVRAAPATFDAPRKWKDGRLVFTCSWSDWFHETADAWRDEAWAIIRETPHHTYQILTKRPERIRDHLPGDWGKGYPNVWLGVSVENQRFTERAVRLALIPAAVHFLSCEPLLGPIDLTRCRSPNAESDDETSDVTACLDWVIVGGESGPDGVRREMEPWWLTHLANDCQRYGIPVFVKQDSARRSEQQGRIPDALWALKEMPLSPQSIEGET